MIRLKGHEIQDEYQLLRMVSGQGLCQAYPDGGGAEFPDKGARLFIYRSLQMIIELNFFPIGDQCSPEMGQQSPAS